MSGPRCVHLVVPEGIDDPSRPSGGNTYDRQLRHGLSADGWAVSTQEVAGGWPWPDAEGRRGLQEALAGVPAGSVALVDGLVASTSPEVVVPAAGRRPLVVLVHMPVGAAPGLHDSASREAAVLRAAASVVVTSAWSRQWLLDNYGLDPAKVHVARPGVDPATAAPGPGNGAGDGGDLLCVGAVTPGKGQDVLVSALAGLVARRWRCVCVGSLTRAPEFVSRLREQIRGAGLAERVVLAGTRTGRDLAASYAAAQVLVLPTRGETYGMVVTEALAHGLPVLASAIGGVPEAMGTTPEGARPGLLTPPGDPQALAEAISSWLDDAALRARLREAARRRRPTLTRWSETTDAVGRVLETVR